MPAIPNKINDVVIEFSPKVNRNVDQKIIDALKIVIKKTIVKGKPLNKIYISSANDQHKIPSRHVQGDGKAVDISRINGMKMSVYYPSSPEVKAITDANYLGEAQCSWAESDGMKQSMDAMHFIQDALYKNNVTKHYVNYPDVNIKNYGSAYYGSSYARLQKLKKVLDPKNRFNYKQSISGD